MKTRILIVSFLLILCSSVLIANDLEKFCGVWINPDYSSKGIYYSGKMVHNPDGTCYEYSKVSDTTHQMASTFVIDESWHDSEGNIWYKVTFTNLVHPTTSYGLWKLSKTGDVIEHVWDRYKHPTEINTNHINYYIHYRQE